jgi:hypothetical protein
MQAIEKRRAAIMALERITENELFVQNRRLTPKYLSQMEQQRELELDTNKTDRNAHHAIPDRARASKWMDVIHVSIEKEVLLVRFEEYDQYVDEFHVFESNVSHQGKPKARSFQNLRRCADGHDGEVYDYFHKFAGKIRYHDMPVPDNMECGGVGNWECETYFRRVIGVTMRKLLAADDIFIFSDADEVLSSKTLSEIKTGKIRLPARIALPLYKYSLHWLQSKAAQEVTVASGSWGLEQVNWQAVRNLGCCWHSVYRYRVPHVTKYTGPETGWHLSTFGSLDQIHMKGTLNILEDDKFRVHSHDETRRRVQNGISMWSTNDTFEKILTFPEPRALQMDPSGFRILTQWPE